MNTFIVVAAFAQAGVLVMLVQVRRLARAISTDIAHIYADMHKDSSGHKH